MATDPPSLTLVRHGETAWSLSGGTRAGPTSRSSTTGREQATRARPRVSPGTLSRSVLSSPLSRALETCRLARPRRRGRRRSGPSRVELRRLRGPDHRPTSARQSRAGRSGPVRAEWRDRRRGRPAGRPSHRPGARRGGDVAIFAHGHVLRVLAARWLGLPADRGALFELGTATISRLGWERESRVIELWNEPPARRWLTPGGSQRGPEDHPRRSSSPSSALGPRSSSSSGPRARRVSPSASSSALVPDLLRLLRSVIGDSSAPLDVRLVLVGLVALDHLADRPDPGVHSGSRAARRRRRCGGRDALCPPAPRGRRPANAMVRIGRRFCAPAAGDRHRLSPDQPRRRPFLPRARASGCGRWRVDWG